MRLTLLRLLRKAVAAPLLSDPSANKDSEGGGHEDATGSSAQLNAGPRYPLLSADRDSKFERKLKSNTSYDHHHPLRRPCIGSSSTWYVLFLHWMRIMVFTKTFQTVFSSASSHYHVKGWYVSVCNGLLNSPLSGARGSFRR